MTLLDLCSYLGLGAVGFITANLLIGMLLSLRYSPVRLWPHRHINLFALHRWTAYLAIVLTLTHPLVLLFLRTPRFFVMDILWPIHSYLQPKLNLAGAGAVYLLLIVLVSSLLRNFMPRTVWRNLHYLVFPAAALLFLHSVLTDPNLKDGHPDLLDGGKVFIEIAVLLGVAATVARLRLRKKGFRPVASR
ncbi:MAG TPA: ferric reductase-like transmembrane domain-containing protein [Acidobacteriaceae bacterium]|jgi:predicted ferric reductase